MSLLEFLFGYASGGLLVGSSGSLLGSSASTLAGDLGPLDSSLFLRFVSGLGVSTVRMPLPHHGDLHVSHLALDFLHDNVDFKNLDCWPQLQQHTK